MKVVDLARAVAPEAKHEFVGIRPGEKLHEQMISPEDSFHTFEYPDYYKILPSIHKRSSSPEWIKDGVKVAEGFEYTSGNNKEWMTIPDLQDWIRENEDKMLMK